MKKVVSLFLLLCLTTLVGCIHLKVEDKGQYKFVNITSEEAYNFLYYTNGIRAVYGIDVTKDYYIAPSIDWIEEQYSPYFVKFLADQHLWSYTLNDNDCVMMSGYGLVSGFMINHQIKSKDKKPHAALAIGTCDYYSHIGEGNGHSINFFITADKNGKLSLTYYEPQTRQIVRPDMVYDWFLMRM